MMTFICRLYSAPRVDLAQRTGSRRRADGARIAYAALALFVARA
jgi:hypothetical protein